MKKMMTNKKRGSAMVRLLSLVGGVGMAYAGAAAGNNCTDMTPPCANSELVGYGCHTPTPGSCCQYLQFRCYGTQDMFYLRTDGPGNCVDYNKGPANDFQCLRPLR